MGFNDILNVLRRKAVSVDPINKIRDISINVHVCPLVLWILIICFDTS